MSDLAVSDVVNIQVSLNPIASALRNFGALLILGDSPVIDTQTRIRQYSTLSAVATDFGSTAPEYLAADLFFGQSPQPSTLYIGRWAAAATSGSLTGGALTTAQQALANFTAITAGAMNITVDGTVKALSALDFAAVTTLNGVASIITTALAGVASVAWQSAYNRFVVTSSSSGATSSVSFATPPATGTDVSGPMGLQAAQGGYTVAGIVAETIESAVTTLASLSNNWYGLYIASSAAVAAADQVSVATFIEGASPSRIYGITTQDPNVLLASSTTDIASQIQAGKFTRTFGQYSSTSPYAAASMYGRAFTTDFTANNSTITLMFQQEPGVTAEPLTETQAAPLIAKNCNVFVNYQNNTAIIQPGVMGDGSFFDVIQGTDWLQNAYQTAVFNLLYTSIAKIPQTDAGVNQIVATLDAVSESAVANGLVAPGTWNGPPIGALATGQTLSKGYYAYAAPVSSQSSAARATRTAPTIQIALKLAGAVQKANVIVNVNQ